jgi:ribose-phosphate pyrophosphokinase
MSVVSVGLGITSSNGTVLPVCSSTGSLPSSRPKFLLFSTKKYAALTRSIASAKGYDQGELARKDFPDGEHYTRIDTPCKGRDVAIIGGTVTDEDTLDLYDLASGVVEGGCHRLVLIVPFYGYATMERAVKTGEVVKAKTRARLLSSIPLPGSGGSIVLLDLHVESISYYLEGNLRPWHLSGRPLILEAVRGAVSEGEEFVIASTDAGRAKTVESFANDLLVPASFVFKRRLDSGATTVTAVSAQVSGKHVVIYDDSTLP